MPGKRVENPVEMIGEFLKRALNIGRETIALAEDEAERIVHRLVERGQMTEEEGRRIFSDFLGRLQSSRKDLQSLIDERTRAMLKLVDIPSHEDLRELEEKIEELNGRLDKLLKKRAEKPGE